MLGNSVNLTPGIRTGLRGLILTKLLGTMDMHEGGGGGVLTGSSTTEALGASSSSSRLLLRSSLVNSRRGNMVAMEKLP